MNKVLVLTTSYPKFQGDINGGFVHELSKRLAKDFEIIVLAPYAEGTKKQEEIDGVKIFRHPQFFWKIDLAYGSGIFEKLKTTPAYYLALPFFFLYQLIWTLKICKQYKIQLIHAHWLIPNAFIAVLCKLFNNKIRVLATIHGSDFWGLNNKIGRLLKKYTFKKIDKLAVVSNALKQAVIEFGYVKEISVYPMGIDIDLFSPSGKSEILKEKFDLKGFTILFVGIIAEAKGIKLLLKAMPFLIKEIKDIKLIVVGEGIQKEQMELYAKELGIGPNVVFTGRIQHNDLVAYYNTADLFILPSYAEGFGLVVAEAMSCECLTIASNLPAIKDVIDDTINGFNLPDLNADNIVQVILKVFNLSEGEKKRVKKVAREKIIYKFDWDIVTNNYHSLYLSLS